MATKWGLKISKLNLKRAEETTHMDKDSYGQDFILRKIHYYFYLKVV